MEARKRYGKLQTAELAEAGLFKAAFCSALYSGNDHEIQVVLEAYNKGQKTSYSTVDDLKRLFGVYEIPEIVTKVKVL